MISKNYKFLFVHIPKTGGNSMQSLLRAYSDDEIACTEPAQDGVERFNVINKEYGTVKHTIMDDYKERLPRDLYDSLFKFTIVRNPWVRAMSFYFTPGGFRTEFNKEKFVWLVRRFMPMSMIINDDIDFIMRFENYQEDFKAVCPYINAVYKTPPVLNSSLEPAYRHYYDLHPDLVDYVGKLYREDIDEFGYDYNVRDFIP